MPFWEFDSDMMDCENSLQRQSPVFPWFGIDIGGTLVKLVYFEPLDLTKEEIAHEGETLQNIRHYLTSNRAYGEEGVRDENLELKNVIFRQRLGNIHFIRFPTTQMPNFIDMCVKKNLHTLTLDVFVTGGGAYKFESNITNNMKLKWHKCDELDTLIRGIHFLASHCECECYYYDNVNDSKNIIQRSFSFDDPYPYLLVNAGSGVSVLLVQSQTSYRRVTGSSIGGGTFLGLCCLLTECTTYEEALALAAQGNSEKVDKLIRDIYGGDYERFGLPGQIVASSFGHMCEAERRKSASAADLARSVLVTVLNNLCSIAHLCASTENVNKIIFVGSFLRLNEISLKLIAVAMDFWTKGRIRPIFLKHEGYAGAFGCLRKYVFDNGCPANEVNSAKMDNAYESDASVEKTKFT